MKSQEIERDKIEMDIAVFMRQKQQFKNGGIT